MQLTFWWVEAFVNTLADSPTHGSGNHAAVCVLNPGSVLSQSKKQAAAQKLNAPATVFVCPVKDGFAIEWYSPVTGLQLCGHGTLAAAKVIDSLFKGSYFPLQFFYNNGVLQIEKIAHTYQLSLPRPHVNIIQDTPFALHLFSEKPQRQAFSGPDNGHFIAHFQSEAQVINLHAYSKIIRQKTQRVLIAIAAAISKPYTVVQRVFAPQYGPPEDAATGSAAAITAQYWFLYSGINHFTLLQRSKRTGLIDVACRGERVSVAGAAEIIGEQTIVI